MASLSIKKGGLIAPQFLSPTDASADNTLCINAVLIYPEPKGHSRHSFEGKNCTTRDMRIEVGIAVLKCHKYPCIFDACVNVRDGAAAALGGLEVESQHGVCVVDLISIEQGCPP